MSPIADDVFPVTAIFPNFNYSFPSVLGGYYDTESYLFFILKAEFLLTPF
jgi:hypothetical protein